MTAGGLHVHMAARNRVPRTAQGAGAHRRVRDVVLQLLRVLCAGVERVILPRSERTVHYAPSYCPPVTTTAGGWGGYGFSSNALERFGMW